MTSLHYLGRWVFLMSKRPSINHQMWKELEKRKCIGESRHQSKLNSKEKGSKVEGIYSYNTYSSYKQSSKMFCNWLKQEFPEIKWISDIDKDIASMYIKYREQSGVSAYTYSQDIAMINKTLDLGITKEYCGAANRSLKNITKSRVDNGFRTESQSIETIIKGSGLRRNELYNLKIGNLLVSNDRVTGIIVSKGAKGGKKRVVQVRKKFQKSIYELVRGRDSDEKVCIEVIPKELQTHRLRAEYAQQMIIELKSLGREDPYKELTKSMGHNRISVLVYYGVNQNN